MKSIKATLIAIFLILAIGATVACGAAESPAAAPSTDSMDSATSGSSTSSTTVELAPATQSMPAVEPAAPATDLSASESLAPPEPAAPASMPESAPASDSVTMPSDSVKMVEADVAKEVEVIKEAPAEMAASVEPAMAESAGDAETDSYTEHYENVPSLKAGETDDNQYWSDYLDFVGDFNGFVHRTSLDHRFIITVSDARGTPIPGATVSVSQDQEELASGVTYANGQTIFHPEGQLAGSYTVAVSRDGAEFEKVFTTEDSEWRITLVDEYARPEVLALDVLFLLDATGSMSDEIHQIKATLLSIADQVKSLQNSADLRFGMVAYRDREDDYVTRVYDFDDDISRFSQAVADVEADGGGDTPESLNEALHVALNRPDWRGDDAIKLVFLVADAPPHLDYAQDYDYAEEMVRAREQGIKIFSVASSGLDQQGEYIFRQLAQQTMGKFIFILYGDGMGGLDTPHDVDQFTVNRLDQLIVRLIQEELESTNPQDS